MAIDKHVMRTNSSHGNFIVSWTILATIHRGLPLLDRMNPETGDVVAVQSGECWYEFPNLEAFNANVTPSGCRHPQRQERQSAPLVAQYHDWRQQIILKHFCCSLFSTSNNL